MERDTEFDALRAIAGTRSRGTHLQCLFRYYCVIKRETVTVLAIPMTLAFVQRTGAAARESLRRDRTGGITSLAFHACGNASPLCACKQSLLLCSLKLASLISLRLERFAVVAVACVCTCDPSVHMLLVTFSAHVLAILSRRVASIVSRFTVILRCEVPLNLRWPASQC